MDFATDEELKAALEKYEELRNIPINSSTRSILLRTLAKITNKKVQGNTPTAAEESEPQKVSHNDVSHNEGSQFQLVNSDNVYYALSLSDATYSRVKEIEKVKQVFKYKSDALQAIKHIPGARCIKCETEESARIFVDKQLQHMKENETEAVPAAEPARIEKANSYPSLGTVHMNTFRVIIEEKDLDGFHRAVCGNPHHLITAGDTPAILKPPLRYNALHCAVKSGSLEICEELLETLQGDEFWNKVYPKDPLEIRNRRRDHLLDLYLNTCDKGMHETPLHFACKYGHEEIVKYLLRFSGVLNVEARNMYGETASVLTCSQDGTCSSEAKKKRITDLLSAPVIYYVPVLRAPGNSVCPKLSTPCTYRELVAQECETQQNTRMEATVLSSIAGPMSPLQAKAFYNEWRSPSRSVDRKEAKNMKRTDPDRGLERIGRRLAHRQKVMWAESWNFLNCSCDLSEEEGKKALEQYLATVHFSSRSGAKLEQYNDVESEMAPLMLDIHYQEDEVKSLDANMSASDLAKDGSTVDKALAELMDSKLSLYPSVFLTTEASRRGFVPRVQVFLTGSEPTKLDYDVMVALEDSEVDSLVFPHITQWLHLIRSHSEEEQKKWRTPTVARGRQYSSTTEQRHTPQWQRHSPSGLLSSSPSHLLMTPTRLF